MSLLTTGKIMTEVLVRNNLSTTDSFITDAMLQDWLRDAHTWAASYHKWPFTEGRLSTTYIGSEELYLEGYKAESIRILQIGGKRYQKLNYEDYLIYKENEPAGTDRVFSDFGKLLIVNPNSGGSGTLTAYGQYQPIIDPTDLTVETVFSSFDAEANEAIVEKMSSYLKRRDSKPQEAELHDKRAMEKLEEVWRRAQDEQFNYKTHRSRGGIWQRFDVINGWMDDETFRRNQF